MASITWGAEVAEVYDTTYAAMFEPSVLDPITGLLAELARGGPVLEFAVATGRVALALSAQGIEVHGLELSRPGMAEDPAPGGGRGEDPAGGPVPGGRRRGGKDARGFASGGRLDAALPSAALVRDLDQASGPARRCQGATDDEVAGMLGRWEAAEAWCASAKLGVVAALIGRRARPGFEPGKPGGLPGAWAEGLTQEVSNELGVSMRAADALIGLAAVLQERLVLTREALAGGVISLAKARIIAEATAVLDDDRAAAAETLIAGQLAGKTPGQVAALIARAVVTVDPEGARKRRERAQREDARVRFWREHAGTAALAAFGLPPMRRWPRTSTSRTGRWPMRRPGRPARWTSCVSARSWTPSTASPPPPPPRPRPRPPPQALPPRAPVAVAAVAAARARVAPARTTPQTGPAASRAPAGTAPAGTAQTGPGRGERCPGGGEHLLTIPAATLLGLAERPGEAHGLGVIDPALARQLAAAAARHPRSTWCLTVTDDDGHAIAHGCAKPAQKKRKPGQATPRAARDGPRYALARAGPGPDGGYGTGT